MSVLLAGGTGYIGSHTAIDLIGQGYDVVLVDNLYNSDRTMAERIESITGRQPKFYCADAADAAALRTVFAENDIECVIHFAGYKAVGESVGVPLRYYRNNLDTTLTLLETMREYGCSRIVFSSSATVYSASEHVPYREEERELGCTNPYGWTKYMNERILTDAAAADPALSVVLLRYFNPVGAHESGKIGEKPNGVPGNLMPFIMQVAAGQREYLNVFGNDYPTHDGTGVRDYIHVMDLARGHVCALEYALGHTGCEVVNLGTGRGYSVLDVVKTFERVNGVPVPYRLAARRPGDIAVCYADTRKAKDLFGWEAARSLEDMCRDAWAWQKNQSGEE